MYEVLSTSCAFQIFNYVLTQSLLTFSWIIDHFTFLVISMRRNSNLELRLLPPDAGGFGLPDWCGKEEEEEEQQQMTIFYNGQVAVCDVTELQARAIISFASREMEEKSRTPSSSSEPSSPVLQSPVYSPAAGLSMKRSLQRFLQKRKNRIQAAFPYHHL